jgi:hypothetical protein
MDNAVGGVKTTFAKLCKENPPVKIVGPASSTVVDITSTPGTVSGKGEYTGTSVSASDPAAIDIPDFQPSLEIKKYAGPVGSNCNVTTMQDETYVATNLKFEYCYVIKSVGNECVLNLTLSDSALGGVGTRSIGKLCKSDAPVSIIGLPTTTSAMYRRLQPLLQALVNSRRNQALPKIPLPWMFPSINPRSQSRSMLVHQEVAVILL